MLKLTVLLRYSRGGKRFCETLGIIEFNEESREIVGDQSTTLLNCKYIDMKSIICDLFTSGKSQKVIFNEIRRCGMKIVEPRFSDNKEYKEIAILIDD